MWLHLVRLHLGADGIEVDATSEPTDPGEVFGGDIAAELLVLQRGQQAVLEFGVPVQADCLVERSLKLGGHLWLKGSERRHFDG